MCQNNDTDGALQDIDFMLWCTVLNAAGLRMLARLARRRCDMIMISDDNSISKRV